MRIGVLGDTRNNRANVRAIVRLFHDAGVQRVVHAGDIAKAKALDAPATQLLKF